MNWSELHETLRYEEMEEALGLDITARTTNGQHTARCPLSTHGGPDRNPSFGINVSKGVWNCFSCGGGSVPKLIQELFGYTQEESLNWLSQFSDIGGDQFIRDVERWLEREPERIERTAILPWYPKSVLPPHEQGAEAYLAARHISDGVRRQLGICFSSTHSRHRYSGPALIIPHLFGGELRGWQERWMDWPDVPVPKYTNSDDFPKKDTLYNYDNVEGDVVCVESALTVATLASYGHQAVATFGASISPTQLKLLRSVGNLYIAFDNDQAGYKAAKQIESALSMHTTVWIVPPPLGEKADLGELSEEEVRTLLECAELA